jgi:hypothetical protein
MDYVLVLLGIFSSLTWDSRHHPDIQDSGPRRWIHAISVAVTRYVSPIHPLSGRNFLSARRMGTSQVALASLFEGTMTAVARNYRKDVRISAATVVRESPHSSDLDQNAKPPYPPRGPTSSREPLEDARLIPVPVRTPSCPFTH